MRKHLAQHLLAALVCLLGSLGVAQAQTGLTLRGDAVTGAAGDEVTVVFRTVGFWQITEGMGTIQWTPTVMDYVHAGDFGIPEITNGTFSLIPTGRLIFQWSSDNVTGNTLDDGTVLFSLTFGLHGSPGASTTVAFTDGWTELHFQSAENINLPFSSDPANVSIVPEPASGFLVLAGLAGCLLWYRRRRLRGPC
ncbi:PEP-CTERM protein-sorting domain-containing protein [Terrimicrobium sacchariphilum]|uniref:PEP-CTERM protein-sorting domain-containing protein n=1 Tax=Terrimicrobium sacchariphilum TaxID=690879 RepID=A0A146G9C1_TERSA|nr:PEP-CTERM sorting domain-containing protein [Terrimicrobium sacchariphilum]GAT34070.1 PEP-CTERM protein-sorting domain-containing protein [Terrimicrobium sacchariphilum]